MQSTTIMLRAFVIRIVAVQIGALLAASAARGASDTWNQFGGTHAWTNPLNWVSGTQYPNGIGDVAYLTADLTASQQIDLHVAITAGVIVVGDAGGATTNSYNIGKGTSGSFHFNNGASAAVVSNLVTVNNFLDQSGFDLTTRGDLLLYAASGSTFQFFSTTFVHANSGGNDIIKRGAGTVYLGRRGNMAFTGNVIVLEGLLQTAQWPNGQSNNFITYPGASYQFSDNDEHIGSLRGRGQFLTGGANRFVVGTNAFSIFPTSRWVLDDGGAIRPGDDGTNIVGNLSLNNTSGGFPFLMTNNGSLYIDITGTVAAASDRLRIDRQHVYVSGGVLRLHPTGGYVPQTGDVHTVIQAITVDGGCIETNLSLFKQIVCDTCPGTIGWTAFLANTNGVSGCTGYPTELRVRAYFIPPGTLLWIR